MNTGFGGTEAIDYPGAVSIRRVLGFVGLLLYRVALLMAPLLTAYGGGDQMLAGTFCDQNLRCAYRVLFPRVLGM